MVFCLAVAKLIVKCIGYIKPWIETVAMQLSGVSIFTLFYCALRMIDSKIYTVHTLL